MVDLEGLRIVAERFRAYQSSYVRQEISEYDDMLDNRAPGAIEHYFSVGRSAIDIIVRGMISVGRTDFETILDLPCGGGRVTRHLAAFFPEAKLFVGELNHDKRRFVAEMFDAEIVETASDFSDEPMRRYDLIFVGSLLTHFDAELFRRALNWFISALAPGGLLIATLHGRRHLHHHDATYRDPRWEGVRQDYLDHRFGFRAFDSSPSYGANIVAPSWVLQLIEADSGTRIVSFEEAAWDDNQDALILQKSSLTLPYDARQRDR
jgi:SAM-dependent methyltransferase